MKLHEERVLSVRAEHRTHSFPSNPEPRSLRLGTQFYVRSTNTLSVVFLLFTEKKKVLISLKNNFRNDYTACVYLIIDLDLGERVVVSQSLHKRLDSRTGDEIRLQVQTPQRLILSQHVCKRLTHTHGINKHTSA